MPSQRAQDIVQSGKASLNRKSSGLGGVRQSLSHTSSLYKAWGLWIKNVRNLSNTELHQRTLQNEAAEDSEGEQGTD